MLENTQRNKVERAIEIFDQSHKRYRTAFEEHLSRTYHPGDKVPSGCLSYIEHYTRMFCWVSILSPDTLERLNAAILDIDTINPNNYVCLLDFSKMIDEVTANIEAGNI